MADKYHEGASIFYVPVFLTGAHHFVIRLEEIRDEILVVYKYMRCTRVEIRPGLSGTETARQRVFYKASGCIVVVVVVALLAIMVVPGVAF